MHDSDLALDRTHYFWIDTLRGAAAFIVLISHVSIFGLYGYEHVLATWPPTRLLWAGHQAVVLFFVISGFALYLLFEQIEAARLRWPSFMLARFLRLYPPYLASLALGLLVLGAPTLFGLTSAPDAPIIANGRLTADTLIGHLLMIGDFDAEAINPPIWTLVYEARLSLLFPLIYFLVKRGGWRTMAAVTAMWIVQIGLAWTRELYFPLENPIPGYILGTINFSIAFFAGAVIAKHRIRITAWISACRPSLTVSLAVLAVFVFMYSYNYDWPQRMPRSFQRIGETLSAAAASYFVALAISFPAPAMRGIGAFFGKISYSLYLVHQPVIMATVLLCFGQYSAPQLWVISITGSIAFAWLFYLAIEKPTRIASRAVRTRTLVAASASAPRQA
jgi:peptidoglycan/LPS O-acetylase OafA/YrhL